MNTIIAGNLAGVACNGSVVSLGFNLDGDGSCNLTLESPLARAELKLQPNPLLPGHPLLGPLADHGGPTETHALLVGSPARDHIPLANCSVPADQRGLTRAQGPGCDIGAYEVGDPCAVFLDAGYANATLNLDFSLGALELGNWSTWLFVQNFGVQLWTFPLPVIDPPASFPVSFPLPSFGDVLLVSYVATGSGIQCIDFEIVDTGGPGPSREELEDLVEQSRILDAAQ